MLLLRILIFSLIICENFCYKTIYKSNVNDVILKYNDLVKGNVDDVDKNIINNTVVALSDCSEDEDDDDSLSVCFCNQLDCVELYCGINYYLEISDCIESGLNISYTTNPNILYIYDNLKIYDESVGTGLVPIDKLDKSYSQNQHILILTELSKNNYEFMQVNLKCINSLFENRIMKKFKWLEDYTLTVNLISFFCLVAILLIFTLIKELGYQISGKCWIMFSITSLRNYNHMIFLSLFFLSAKKDPTPVYFFFSITVAVTLILLARIKSLGYGKEWFMLSALFVFIHISFFFADTIIDTTDSMFDTLNLMFHITSYFSTEFSIYFWLNMICFDVFYSTK